MSYRSDEEKIYFGSDLNKFISENCSKEMTAINIDLLLYKRSKKHIRIIESKHENEKIPYSQNVKIINLTNGKTYHIKHKQDFIDWLEFKKELE